MRWGREKIGLAGARVTNRSSRAQPSVPQCAGCTVVRLCIGHYTGPYVTLKTARVKTDTRQTETINYNTVTE